MSEDEKQDDCKPGVKAVVRLEKFDGEWFPGAVPVEVIELGEINLTDEES